MLGEQTVWAGTAEVLTDTTACLDKAEEKLKEKLRAKAERQAKSKLKLNGHSNGTKANGKSLNGKSLNGHAGRSATRLVAEKSGIVAKPRQLRETRASA